MDFVTNCRNCGAPLKHEPYETIVKCGYCGSEYHRDRFGRLEENYITINFMGKTRKFYIETISYKPIIDSYRDLIGHYERIAIERESNIEMTLISV